MTAYFGEAGDKILQNVFNHIILNTSWLILAMRALGARERKEDKAVTKITLGGHFGCQSLINYRVS